MAIYNTSASLANTTIFDGTGNKAPIDAGDAINISFYAKRLSNSGWTTNEVNVFLSEDGNTNWTCISGFRASQTNGAYNYFSVGKDAYQKYVYTAVAPSENGDLVYGGGSAVSTWQTCSVQITSSVYFNTKNYPMGSYTHNRRQVFDSFSVTANKPLVEASNTGVLIYQTGDNYIRMGADGLEVKGGDINANTVDGSQVSATTFQVRDTVRNESTSSDLVIQTQESTTAKTGDILIQAGGALATGQTGGSVFLTAGSGSGAGGPLDNGHGSVIIGPTAAPRLIISGSTAATGGHTDSEIRLRDNEGDDAALFFSKDVNADGAGYFKTTQANSSIVLGAGSWGDHLLIRSNGEVHIPGGANDAAQSHQLYVTGNVKIHNGSIGIDVNASATDGRLDAGNDVVAYSSSDIRFKKNTTPIQDALFKIQQLQGIEFDWIPNEKHHGYEGHDVGVIAQEVEKVLPEVVTTRDSGYMAVKYEKMIPLLIEGIKEQQIKIDELRKELEEIKND